MTSRRTAAAVLAVCLLVGGNVGGGQEQKPGAQEPPWKWQGQWVPDKIGTWKQEKDYSAADVYRLTGRENAAFASKLEHIASILHATPMMNPQAGFETWVRTRYIYWENTCNSEHPCARGPAGGEVMLLLRALLRISETAIVPQDAEGAPGMRVALNDLNYTRSLDHRFGYEGLFDENGQEVTFEPIETGRLAGFPIYDHERVVMTNITRPRWLRLTREEWLRVYIRFLEGVRDKQRADVNAGAAADPAADWRKEKENRRRDFEKGYAEMKKINPAMAEELRRNYEQTERETDAALAKSPPKLDVAGANRLLDGMAATIDAFKRQLAGMTAEERRSTAWIVAAGRDHPELVEPGTDGARPMIRLNPDFFDPAAGRTDVQLIVLEFWANGATTMEEAETAGPTDESSLIYKLMRTLDVKKISALLTPRDRRSSAILGGPCALVSRRSSW